MVDKRRSGRPPKPNKETEGRVTGFVGKARMDLVNALMAQHPRLYPSQSSVLREALDVLFSQPRGMTAMDQLFSHTMRQRRSSDAHDARSTGSPLSHGIGHPRDEGGGTYE